MSRLNYPKCRLTTCALCARNYLGKTVNLKGKQPHKPEEEKDFNSNEEELWKSEKSLLVKDLTDSLKIIDQLKTEQIRFEEQKDEEIRKLKTQLQKEKEKETEARYSSEEFPPLGNSQIARPFMEAEVHYSGNTTTTLKIRKITNQLYNVKVEFEILNCPMFGTTAIIDMGASTRCINKKVIPEDALEPLTQTVFFNGLNSRQQVTHRIKQGSFLIEGNKFKIPLIYEFDMNDSNGIEMLIGANFLRSIKGGIRIKGTTINPATGREIKGKERMVFNYKSLNDNTYKDQYSLPGINTIIKRVGGTKIFSKFDLKSGFHHVAMDEESIPWTAFLVPGGLYE
ncbi:RNA-directed DNA polymerase [Tanacetum coccineum]